MRRFILLVLFILGVAMPIKTLAQRGEGIAFELVGVVMPRHAREIPSSNWSVGAETMDRDYTIYANWKEYLGPLGIKKARVQSGWAKTEKEPGVYDWSWMDEIIFDMVDQGVEPWISVSYGNAIYTEGGGTRLGAAIPTNEDVLEAWDRYTRGLVARYKHVVDEWEIWNEPNGHNPPEVYADLLIRTAETIRDIQPEATILGIALAGVGTEFPDRVLSILSDKGKLHLIDQITYHPYNRNPDASYEAVARLRATIGKYSDDIIIRQGENGAPSEWRRTKALSKYNWTELSQSKWALRRMLGDLGRDIPTSIFSIADMKYPDEINRKGLLHIRDDKTVDHKKQAYFSVQALASIFDDRLERIPDFHYSVTSDSSLSVFGYEEKASGAQLVTIWMDGSVPSDSNEKVELDFTVYAGQFEDPVYVDLREVRVYEIPKNKWSREGNTYHFNDIPTYDSPILIADRSVIPIAE